MDLDNCNDVRVINSNGDCGGAPTEYGNLTFNATFRDGIQDMFAQLHAQHPDWLIFGNDAWWPEDGSAEDPDPPGYASKNDIDGTMVEDWTRNWWGENTEKPFEFSGWGSPDPTPYQGWKPMDFAKSVRALVQWQDAGKLLVINGKWCNLPKEGITNGDPGSQNECGVNANGDDEIKDVWVNGVLVYEERQPWRKSREVRFTMALATMLGEYHNYIGLKTGFVPYWFDEYAVIHDPEDLDFPFKAAATEAEKAAGVGWLGWPAAPTEEQMWAVKDVPDYTKDDYNEIYLGESLSQALAMTPPASRNAYINNRAWIRYFDHGVVLLNPTDTAKTIHLNGDYYRIRGRSASVSPGSRYFDGYNVNDGSRVVDQTVVVQPREGLFLVRNHFRGPELIVSSEKSFGQYAIPTCLEHTCDPGYHCYDNSCTWGETYLNFDESEVDVDDFLVSTDQGFPYVTDWKSNVKLEFPAPTSIPANLEIEHMILKAYRTGMGHGDEDSYTIGIYEIPPPDHLDWRFPGYLEWMEPGWHSSENISFLEGDDITTPEAIMINLIASDPSGDAPRWVKFRSSQWGGEEDTTYSARLQFIYRPLGGTGQTSDPTIVYQHGVDGYLSEEDTHIVTTNWEAPTPHDTFPVIYLRTSGNEDEVFSSLVRFENLDLPPDAQITNAVLSLYYSGQSVNGGDVRAYVSSTKPVWNPPQTTWATYQNNIEWLGYGAKGVEDRTYYASVRTVNYTEVGEWLSFNVTSMMQEDIGEFILHASHMGVNKNIQLCSNDYWDASKRPKLMIWYE